MLGVNNSFVKCFDLVAILKPSGTNNLPRKRYRLTSLCSNFGNLLINGRPVKKAFQGR